MSKEKDESLAFVLLHYWPGSGKEWKSVVKNLHEFECFTPDLAGFGDAAPTVNDFSMEAYASSVEAVTKEHQITKGILAWHCFDCLIICRDVYRH